MNTHYTIVQLPPNDLRELIKEVVEEVLQQHFSKLIEARSREDPILDFVSVEVAASILHKSKPTIYKLLREGVLSPHRIPGTKSMLLSKNEIVKILNKPYEKYK